MAISNMAQPTIGTIIKASRKAAGKTAMQVAVTLPADLTTVFRYESKGNVSPETIVQLAEVLEARHLLNDYCTRCPVGKAKKEAVTAAR